MKLLYLDIFSGISGDMFVGAMLDLGVERDILRSELGELDLEPFELSFDRQERSSISGIKFEVLLPDGSKAESHAAKPVEHSHSHSHSHGHSHSHSHSHSHDSTPGSTQRDFQTIKSLIRDSRLSDWVKEKSIAVFARIAEGEGKVHGMPAEKVHFHEVGALDSIVDIVGACICLEQLGRPRVCAAAVVEGHGWVNCAHGRFPIPTAATMEILSARGIPISQCDEPHELITPTGAALLAEFSESFGPMRDLKPQRIGYGLGSRENKTRPNVLRAVIGEQSGSSRQHDWETDSVITIEANIDDATGEQIGHVIETAMKLGALDTFVIPLQMKKSRPGSLLTILCETDRADEFTELLLRRTSTFGVRRQLWERRKLRREFGTVETPFGSVSVKTGCLNEEVLHVSPEFESCREAAERHEVPINQVYDAARSAWAKSRQES